MTEQVSMQMLLLVYIIAMNVLCVYLTGNAERGIMGKLMD